MADIIVDGRTRVSFVPSIANIAAPTVAELNAGTILTLMLVPTGLENFENTTALVDNTSMASTWDTSLPGRQSMSGTPSLLLKRQDAGSDPVFTLLTTPNTNGFIVVRDELDQAAAWATAQRMEVYPVRTAAHSMVGRNETNSVLKYRVPTPVTGPPALKAISA